VGASFGPVNLQLTKQSLVIKLGKNVSFAFGAILGDAFLLLFWLVLGQVIDINSTDRTLKLIGLTGGSILVLISIRSFYLLMQSNTFGQRSEHSSRFSADHYGMLGALAITILSPFGITLWLGIASRVITLTETFNPLTISFAYTLIILGDIVWFSTWLTAVALIRKRLPTPLVKTIFYLSDIAIFGFGLHMFIQALKL